jgi:hypothetical protein
MNESCIDTCPDRRGMCSTRNFCKCVNPSCSLFFLHYFYDFLYRPAKTPLESEAAFPIGINGYHISWICLAHVLAAMTMFPAIPVCARSTRAIFRIIYTNYLFDFPRFFFTYFHIFKCLELNYRCYFYTAFLAAPEGLPEEVAIHALSQCAFVRPGKSTYKTGLCANAEECT